MHHVDAFGRQRRAEVTQEAKGARRGGGAPRNGDDANHGASGVKAGDGDLVVENEVADVAQFVIDRVVQGVRAKVAPIAIETSFAARGAGPHDVEHPRRDLEPDFGGADLGRGDGERHSPRVPASSRHPDPCFVEQRAGALRQEGRTLQIDAELSVAQKDVWIGSGLGHPGTGPRP